MNAEEEVAFIDATDEIVQAERASMAQNRCPRSGQPIIQQGGSVRPSCSFCDCGEYDEQDCGA